MKWYKDITENEQIYNIGGVCYMVDSRYYPFPSSDQQTIRDRVVKILQSDFTDLTMFEPPNMIEDENVCSVAGKEE